MDELLEHNTVLENGVRYKLKTHADGLVVRDSVVPMEMFDSPKFEPHLQKALDDAREALANTNLDELLSDFLTFEGYEDSGERSLFNQVLDEYLRATGIQWRYWDNNEYEFCVHLMNEFGIGAKPVTDATWEAECCHWGIGIGGDLMEAVFKCYLDYVRDVGDGVDK